MYRYDWRTFYLIYLWIQVNVSLRFSFRMQYIIHATCSVPTWLFFTLRQLRDQPTLSWAWQWWEGTPGTSNHEGRFLEKHTMSQQTALQPSKRFGTLGCLVRIHGSKTTSIQRAFPGASQTLDLNLSLFLICVGDSQLILLRNLTKVTSRQNLLPSLLAFSHAATRKPDFERAFLTPRRWLSQDQIELWLHLSSILFGKSTILGWLTSCRSC